MKTNIKIFANIIEDTAREQIDNIAKHPAFSEAKIRIMPDVHAGKGCVCGFTADLGDKVVPNLIGVDIGCGVLTVCLGKINVDYKKLDNVIRTLIPSGQKVHAELKLDNNIYDFTYANPKYCYINFSIDELKYFERSLGTLGGGNHFLEIGEDEEGNKYLVIHTGSRNLGKKVCEYWQQVAIDKLPKAELTDDDIDFLFKA